MEKNKRKAIKKIEMYLRNYNHYLVGIKNMKEQLDFIMPNMTARYELSEGSSGTFNISSSTEKYAIDRIESKRALELHESIQKYELIVNSIDGALKELEPIEKDFINLRYFKLKTIQQTAIDLGYSEKYVFNLRNGIMDKLIISLKGLLTI